MTAQTDSLAFTGLQEVNSHSLSGSVRVTHLLGGQYGCLGCQRVQYDLWHSSLGCSSLCSLRMVVLPLGWQFFWSLASGCSLLSKDTSNPVACPSLVLCCCQCETVRHLRYVTALLSQLMQHPSQPCCAGSELQARDKGAAGGRAAHKSSDGEPALQLFCCLMPCITAALSLHTDALHH